MPKKQKSTSQKQEFWGKKKWGGGGMQNKILLLYRNAVNFQKTIARETKLTFAENEK